MKNTRLTFGKRMISFVLAMVLLFTMTPNLTVSADADKNFKITFSEQVKSDQVSVYLKDGGTGELTLVEPEELKAKAGGGQGEEPTPNPGVTTPSDPEKATPSDPEKATPSDPKKESSDEPEKKEYPEFNYKLDNSKEYVIAVTGIASGEYPVAYHYEHKILFDDTREDGIDAYTSAAKTGADLKDFIISTRKFGTYEAKANDWSKGQVTLYDTKEKRPVKKSGNVFVELKYYREYEIRYTAKDNYKIATVPHDYKSEGNSVYRKFDFSNVNIKSIVETSEIEFKHVDTNVTVSYTLGENATGTVYYDENKTISFAKNSEGEMVGTISLDYDQEHKLIIVPGAGSYVNSVNGKDVDKLLAESNSPLKEVSGTDAYTYQLDKEDGSVSVEFLLTKETIVNELDSRITIADAVTGTVLKNDLEEKEYVAYIVPAEHKAKVSAKYSFNINKDTKTSWWGGTETIYDTSYTIPKNLLIENTKFKGKAEERKFYKTPIIVVIDGNGPVISVNDTAKDWYTEADKELVLTGYVSDGQDVTKATVNASNATSGVSKVVVFKQEFVDQLVTSAGNSVDDQLKKHMNAATASTEDYAVATFPEEEVKANRRHNFTADLSAFMPDETTEYVVCALDKAGNLSKVSATVKVDKNAPVINEVKVLDLVQNEGDGDYYTSRDRVRLSVAACELSSSESGVKTIQVFRNGEAVGDPVEIYPSTCMVWTSDEIKLDKEDVNTFSVQVTDALGHASKIVTATEANVYYDKTVPSIEIHVGDEVVGKAGYTYFNEAQRVTEIVVALSKESKASKVSGLQTIKVYVDDSLVEEDMNGKSFVIDPSKKSVKETYELLFDDEKAHDIVVCVDTYTVENTVGEKGVKGDFTAPSVVESDALMAKATSVEKDFVLSDILDKDFGFFSGEEIAYAFSFLDEGALVGDISYKFVPYDEKDGKLINLNGDEIGEILGAHVEIPMDKKGYIFVEATDRVGNNVSNLTMAGFVTESDKKHKEVSSLEFTLAETDKKVASKVTDEEVPLYQDSTAVEVSLGDTWSGIRSIEWSVTSKYDDEKNILGKVNVLNDGTLVYAGGKDAIGKNVKWKAVEKDENLVTNMTATIPVEANSNDIVVFVKFTDRAGHTSEKSIVLSIDKTAPAVSLEFDNLKAGENRVFDATRKATVTVLERNFDEKAVNFDIKSTFGNKATISGWVHEYNEVNPDLSKHVAIVTFDREDDYEFQFDCTDLAGNKSNLVKEEKFSVDKTAPVVSIDMTGTALNGNYFAADRTATITVVEHYFNPAKFVVKGTANDLGNAIAFPVLSDWTSNGDVHTATLRFTTDGRYSFTVNGSDMAGNESNIAVASEFVVDKTTPEVAISNIVNQSANNDVVAPVITFGDTNFSKENVQISLVGANRGNVDLTGLYTVEESATGMVVRFADFAHEQAIDDLYTLTATQTDRAGNSKTDVVRFSVNRFGSVYALDDTVIANKGKYLQNAFDVVITETNVDVLDLTTIRVTVTKNGKPVDLEQDKDYTVKVTGGDGLWSQYVYTIKKAVFENDGAYIVTVYSKDVAGNTNENIDETKRAEIGFGIDATSPVIAKVNLDDETTDRVEDFEAIFTVSDNMVLDHAEAYLDGEAVDFAFDEKTGKLSFNIHESNEKRKVVIKAFDAAGNEAELEVSEILITSNLAVRLINKMNVPVAASAAGAVVVVAVGTTVGVKRRKAKTIKTFKVDAK